METTYTLIDGVQRNSEHPTTFQIPTKEEKEKLKVGDYCKVGFEEGEKGERMWVKITEINGDTYKGELDNDPVQVKSIQWGDMVEFNSKHIIGTMD